MENKNTIGFGHFLAISSSALSYCNGLQRICRVGLAYVDTIVHKSRKYAIANVAFPQISPDVPVTTNGPACADKPSLIPLSFIVWYNPFIADPLGARNFSATTTPTYIRKSASFVQQCLLSQLVKMQWDSALHEAEPWHIFKHFKLLEKPYHNLQTN